MSDITYFQIENNKKRYTLKSSDSKASRVKLNVYTASETGSTDQRNQLNSKFHQTYGSFFPNPAP